MLLTIIVILLLLGAVCIPLVPRRAKGKATANSNEPGRPELSNYVVNEAGELEEIATPRDTSLSQ